MKFIIIFFAMIIKTIFLVSSQTLELTYVTELQYSSTSNRVNWCNLIRFDLGLPVYEFGEFNAATLHIYKTNDKGILKDRLTFSNIEEDSYPASFAVLGYTQYIGKSALFFGVRNMNEDYFNTYVTSLFTNSSCGIYPTISTNYSIANYPNSSLCLHFYSQLNKFGIKSSIYNGAGYNGWSKDNNPFIINFRHDGIFGVTELNYQTDNEKYFIGASIHNNISMCNENKEWQEESDQEAKKKKAHFTWWCYGEQQLFQKNEHKINLLVQYSENSYKNNYCKRYGGIGAVWTFNDKKNHQYDFGVICTGAQFYDSFEIDNEITFSYQLNNNLILQPAAHIIKGENRVQTAFILRMIYNLGCNITNR